MYAFIERENPVAAITPDYVSKLEQEWGVHFPAVLREYYLEHNGAIIRECPFEKHGLEFCMVRFYALNYGTAPLEKQYFYARRNRAVPASFIPFALDEDEDSYFWDSSNGKIYYLSLSNVEHPIGICDSMDAFFEILNNSQS